MAIVSAEIFEAAQSLRRSRTVKIITEISRDDHFAQKIVCGNCGSIFSRKKRGNGSYWVCRTHNADKTACHITQIPQSEFERSFLRLYYKLKHGGLPILTQMLSSLETLRNRSLLWREDVIELNKQIANIRSQEQMLTELKTQGLIDPGIFISQRNELTEQLRKAKREKQSLIEVEDGLMFYKTKELIEIIETGPEYLHSFDAELFGELIEKIIVVSNDEIRFRLINGLELPERIERTMR